MAMEDFAISCGVFFGGDLNSEEVTGPAGAGERIGLLGVVALGHKNKPVSRGQLSKRLRHAGEQLDLLFGDRAGKSLNALPLFIGHGRRAEPLKTGEQRADETGESVSVSQNGLALGGVQRLTHLSGRVRVVIQIADESGYGTLEVDVVLPQRIVGIDEQRLAWRELRHQSYSSESECYGFGRAPSHCFRLGSWSVRNSMQPSMCSMACLRALSEEATLCVEKNCSTLVRLSAEQKLPVAPTKMAPISVVNCACTFSQLFWMYFHACSRFSL